MTRLSFILPCYKVEQYIRRCLDSIYNTTLPIEEFEVLCFDDHAPDSTPQILDEYVIRYPNMRVIHSVENVGPGGGRNQMLSIAKGQYVWFVDSDDLVISEAVEPILKIAEKDTLDVLTFNYHEWDFKGDMLPDPIPLKDSNVGTGCELADDAFIGGIVYHMGYPVRFLLKREYLEQNNILFPERMTFGEDTVWMAKVVLYANRFRTIAEYGYIYWHHEDSTCGELNRSYPGKTIFEKSIITASQLLDFSSDLIERAKSTNDEGFIKYALEIKESARNYYINNLPIMLCRTSYMERKNFYHRINAYSRRFELQEMADGITRLLLTPYIGQIISHMMAPIYKITHKK